MTPTPSFAPRRPAQRLALAAIVASLMYFLNTTTQADVSKDEKLAKDIVEKADRIRFPDEGFQVDVAIVSTNGQVTDTRQYRDPVKGSENTIVW
jgi:hypothetical protein